MPFTKIEQIWGKEGSLLDTLNFIGYSSVEFSLRPKRNFDMWYGLGHDSNGS